MHRAQYKTHLFLKMTKPGFDSRITQIISLGWIVALFLIALLYPPELVHAAKSSGSAKTRFGWKFDYDTRGRITSLTDPANKKTKFRYSQHSKGSLSGMIKELPSGSKVRFKFDKQGRRKEMIDSAGTVRYSYDKFGHLSKVNRDGAPSIIYSYDTRGRIKSISIGLRFSLQYIYDYRGRLTTIVTPTGNIRFSYIGKTGAVVRRLPNGISTKWIQNPDGGLKSITHMSSGNRPLAQYQYTYRLDGLITSIKELTPSGVQTRRYLYDKAQRLISSSGASRTKIDFTYDRLGNRTKRHQQGQNPILAQYDWAGRLVSYGGHPCDHDPLGNLTTRAGSPNSYTFGDTGLLKTVSLTNGTINYSYDGDGYLISRSIGASMQTFVPDPLSDNWQPLVLKDSYGQLTYYIYDGASPLMAITEKKAQYFLHDHLGSVRLVADGRGDILKRLDYTPFGQPEKKSAGVNLQPGFAGLFLDKTASVYLTRARVYDPELASFLQCDPEHRVPSGSQKDLSAYTYCGGDPVNYKDVNGAQPIHSVPFLDRKLNEFGTGSVWIGRNRSGGIKSYTKDSRGQFPLGDTRIRGKSNIDNYARLHDIEYWVSTHFPKGTEVKTPAPGGKYEYFESKGDTGLTSVNLRVAAKVIAAPNRFTPLSNMLTEGRGTPRTNNPVELKYDPIRKSMTTVRPYNYNHFPHNDPSSLRNSLRDQTLNRVSTGLSQYPSSYVGAADKILSVASLITDRHDVRNANIANPGDYATTAKNVSYGLSAVGTFAPGLIGVAASGTSHLIKTGIAVGNQIRSQTIQNRTIGLIGLPLGQRSQITGQQQLRSHWGSFDVKGANFESKGAWALENQYRNRQRISSSNAYANTEFTNYRLSSGALMTGKQRIAESRIESSNSYYRHRTSTFSGNISFSGADFNRTYANYEKRNLMENNFSGFNQGNVGGIRLTGAGKALSHLGSLEGIALDKTNDRMVLVSNDQNPINLPPLRMDDVVTIFRSVYIHGEAPSVSIDPLSDKKTEKWMKVRHGAATNNTYVGWVMYEADRIMKNYSLGKDNKTKKKVYSRAPGYRDFNAIGSKSRIPQWERFWIVPASLTRTQGKTSELTIFDVPLKLETEKMEWDGTKLVTARSPRPSKSAAAFTHWFTSQYDKIAKEAKLRPPKHCGFERPVAVYEELRRIALVTAIAEVLRDQNVPFPGWMSNYPVKPCICDRKTPVLRVEGKGYKVTGGVQMAASDKDIRTYKGNVQITQLAKTTIRKIESKPLLAPVSFQENGKTYKAVTLPGADTQSLGANIILHNDLESPVLQKANIGITRQFNSFHNPRGMFGRGWTIDLPRLEEHKKPTKRTGNSVSFQIVYQLSSPLNTWSERFAEYRHVPEVNGQLLVPSQSSNILGMADSQIRDIGERTKKIIFRDGSSWHFNSAGNLVARSDKRTKVIYQRDNQEKITAIKSWQLKGQRKVRQQPDVYLKLTYGTNGKLVRSIEASSPKLNKSIKALYFYNNNGQLAMVMGTGHKTKYTYRNGLLASVTDKDNKYVAFNYNRQGQIVAEKRADGKEIAYKRITTSKGQKVIAVNPTTQKLIEAVEYGADFFPRKRSFDDGSSIAWKPGGKSLETTVTEPDGKYVTIAESNDGKSSTLKTSEGEVIKTKYDNKGRVIHSKSNVGPTIEQKWRSDGKLKAVISDDKGILPKYNQNGKVSSVIVAPPDQTKSGQVKQFVQVNQDAKGRVTHISDDLGSQLQIAYDITDQPSLIRSNQGSVEINRNAKGQIKQVGTSWGSAEKYEYDQKGDLSKVTLQKDSGQNVEQATITLTNGQVSKIQQADGGEISLDYHQTGKQKGLLKKVKTTENLALAYSYDSSDRLTGIDIGGSSAPAYRVNYNYDSKGRLKGISYAPPATLTR